MQTHRTRCLIIGAGPAGYTAAIYAARAGLAPLLLTGMTPGGQLTITTDVENYPGFARGVQGPALMDEMRAQAEHVGAAIVGDTVVSVDLSERPFRAVGDSGDTYLGDTLVIATGAQARWLGLESERIFAAGGVSACATCDGFFYRGKEVVVVGGGNTAVEEALYLSNLAARVTVIHRRDAFRAERILQDRLMDKPNVRIVWEAAIDEILGETEPFARVTGVRLRHVRSGATREIATDGVFVAIGHAPASDLFRGQLDMDAAGYVRVTPGSTRTSTAGCFSAGDVSDPVFRQAITSAGMGCMAALEAEKFLAEHAGTPAERAAERAERAMIEAW